MKEPGPVNPRAAEISSEVEEWLFYGWRKFALKPRSLSDPSLRAVTSAFQHAQVGAPRSDRLAILVGHHAGQLMQMSEVVSCPCRKKFR